VPLTMTDDQLFSTRGSSAALERAVLERFRKISMVLPASCGLYREVWDQSTVLCLDFQRCPEELADLREQGLMLLMGASHLGLAQAISFRLGRKIKGWVNFASTDS
jgi:hypothetical protein